MWKARGLLLACAVGVLAGCAATPNLDRAATDPRPDETFIVLKVQPANMRIVLRAGAMEGGAFKPKVPSLPVVNGFGVDGYVVARVSSGQPLGITLVSEMQDRSGVGGTAFVACDGRSIPVVTPQGGKVLYLTDVHYQRLGGRLSASYRQDLGSAARHVRSNYPGISRPVEAGGFSILPVRAPCPAAAPVVIPIFVPK